MLDMSTLICALLCKARKQRRVDLFEETVWSLLKLAVVRDVQYAHA